MYDPELQRFTSIDPVRGGFREPPTLHQYLYCLNNPINRWDPDGQYSLVGTLGASAIRAYLTSMYEGVLVGAQASIEGAQNGLTFQQTLFQATKEGAKAVAIGAGVGVAVGLSYKAARFGLKSTFDDIFDFAMNIAKYRSKVRVIDSDNGRYLYRTMHKNDPNAKHFLDIGDIGSIKPKGGHNDLHRHVNLHETDSIFTSWSTDKDVNWGQWGGDDYIQVRVDTWNMDNYALDVHEWSNFPDQLEVSIIGKVLDAERIR